MKRKNVVVKCPHCQKEFTYLDSEFRPFCSERCRMVDLGHWLDGRYTIPGEKVEESVSGEAEDEQKAVPKDENEDR
jgi:uncharacterized protein